MTKKARITAERIIFSVIAALGAIADQAFAEETAEFTRQITFGDSLSDSGRYATLTPPGADSFTTNPDPVWVEIIAQSLGLDSDSVAIGGTNFAEGGARVFAQDPGIGTRLNIRAQVEGFLASGGFSSRDIVTIQGGGNDVLALGSTASFDDVTLAAVELAALTRRIVDEGAGLVVVSNLPILDIFNAPFEAQLRADGTNALFIDVNALYEEALANPAAFGFTNIVDPACPGSALFCLPQDLAEPGANETYLLADSVHPTGAVHGIIADMTLAALRAPSQIGQLSLVAEAMGLAAYQRASALARQAGERGALRFIGGASYDRFEIDDLNRHNGAERDGVQFSAGLDYQVTDRTGAGAMVGFYRGDGDFGKNSGGFESHGVVGTVYYRGQAGALRWSALASVGYHDFDEVTRIVVLGPLARTHIGETDGLSWSAGAEAGFDLVDRAWVFGPFAGLGYFDTSLSAYEESNTASTSMGFSKQGYEALRAYGGFEVRAPGAAGVRPYARTAYMFDLDASERLITVTPHGAPISLTADAFTPDEDFLSYGAGILVAVTKNLSIDLGVNGDAFRGALSRLNVSARLRLSL